jgi:hypothetical protein
MHGHFLFCQFPANVDIPIVSESVRMSSRCPQSPLQYPKESLFYASRSPADPTGMSGASVFFLFGLPGLEGGAESDPSKGDGVRARQSLAITRGLT